MPQEDRLGAAQHEQTAPHQEGGFLSAPSAEDLRPTQREVSLMQELYEWQQGSAHSRWVLGEPLGR